MRFDLGRDRSGSPSTGNPPDQCLPLHEDAHQSPYDDLTQGIPAHHRTHDTGRTRESVLKPEMFGGRDRGANVGGGCRLRPLWVGARFVLGGQGAGDYPWAIVATAATASV